MEKITVYKEEKTTNKVELEIEDLECCFLKGKDGLFNTNRYLGIWKDDNVLKNVEIFENRSLFINSPDNYKFSIESFLKERNNVEVITEEEFRKALNDVVGIFK